MLLMTIIKELILGGGYLDEVSVSYVRIAECYTYLNENEKIVYYFMEAINFDPTNIEAYGKLAIYYNNKKKYNLSYILLKTALSKIPKEIPNKLFLYKDYYIKYNKIYYELSVVCYYIKLYKQGLSICNFLEQDVGSNLYINYNLPKIKKFYTDKLNIIN